MLDASIYPVEIIDIYPHYPLLAPTYCYSVRFPTENLPYHIRYTAFPIVRYPTGLKMHEWPQRITHCRCSPKGDEKSHESGQEPTRAIVALRRKNYIPRLHGMQLKRTAMLKELITIL